MLIFQRKRYLVLLLSGMALVLQGAALIPEPICRAILRGEIYYTIAHFACYGFLAFIFCLYLRFRRTVFKIRMTDIKVLVMGFAAAAVFGGLTEASQLLSFIDRRPDWYDFNCNLIGSAGGAAAFLVFRHVCLQFMPIPLRSTRFYAFLAAV